MPFAGRDKHVSRNGEDEDKGSTNQRLPEPVKGKQAIRHRKGQVCGALVLGLAARDGQKLQSLYQIPQYTADQLRQSLSHCPFASFHSVTTKGRTARMDLAHLHQLQHKALARA